MRTLPGNVNRADRRAKARARADPFVSRPRNILPRWGGRRTVAAREVCSAVPMTIHALQPVSFLPGLALALGVGMLIGVERGWQLRDEKPGARVAGIRTFAILGLLGGLTGIGLTLGGPLAWLALLLVLGAVAALLLGYGVDMVRDANVSATSTLAAIVTLALGAYATTGGMALAAVGAGAMLILLASREPLHRAIAATSEADIQALLRLVLVVFVILPLLPNQAMGPFGALNPRKLWLVVVVTSGIAFAGYALSRWLGQQRGGLVAAIVGALISSTAVTLDCARRIREAGSGPAEEAGVAVASTIMFLRGLFLVAILAPLAFAEIAKLVVPALLVSMLMSGLLVWRSRHRSGPTAQRPIKAPGLGLALLFAASVAALSLVSAWVEAHYGGGSGAAVIALGGTVDIDSAIAAVGTLPPGSIPLHLAALAIAAPILFNTLFKLAILLVVGGIRPALWGAASLLAAAMGLAVPIAVSAFG